MNDLELVIKRLDKYMQWSSETIKAWLTTPHGHFNDAAPLEFINQGLGYKVLEYLEQYSEVDK